MKFPIKLEFFREMGRQGFDPESFSGLMTSEQKIDAQFFGGDRSQCGASPVMKVSIQSAATRSI
jgi:hypothetical protein